MFNNPGKSLKGIAKVIFWFGIVVTAAAGIAIIAGITTAAGLPIGGSLLTGILIIAFGVLFSWLSSIGLYALGQLVEDTEANRAVNEKILERLSKSAES